MTDIEPCNVRNDKDLFGLLLGLVGGEESVAAKILDGTHYVLACDAVERIQQLDENDLSTIDAACNEICVFPVDRQVCEASFEKIIDVRILCNKRTFGRRLMEANVFVLTKSCFSKYAKSSSVVAEGAASMLIALFHTSESLLNEVRMDSSFARTIFAAFKKYVECDFDLCSGSDVSARWILTLISTIVSFTTDESPIPPPFQEALFSGSCDVLDLVVSMLRRYGIDTDTVETLVVLEAQYVFRALLDGAMAPTQPQGTNSTTGDILADYMREKAIDVLFVAARTRQEVRRQLVDDEEFSDLYREFDDLVSTLTEVVRVVLGRDDSDDDDDDDDDEGDAGEEEEGDDVGLQEEEVVEEEEEESNDDVSKGTIDSEENASSKRPRLV